MPLSLINVSAQLASAGMGPALIGGLCLALYFLLFLLGDRFLLRPDYPHATGLLYVLESPVMLMAVLLGTALDPVHQAVTVLLFIIALPAFIMDQPGRILLFFGGWVAVFLVMCFAFKDPSLWASDTMHIVEFYFTTIALVNVMLRVRMESMRHLLREEYHLEHEPRTDCLNRYALASRAEAYAGRTVAVILTDMDRFMLHNDFYGHEAGQKMMDHFARILMSSFGPEDVFHYNGDEFLCVMKGADENARADIIAKVRKGLNEFTLEGQKLPLTCAFGCACGTPATVKEFQEMIQLADINAHKAKKTGPSAFLSTEYTRRSCGPPSWKAA